MTGIKAQKTTLPTKEATKSFWHSQPENFLIGHRTTDTLPSSADIVIVGSGITGASIARYLSEDERSQGKSIVMLEAREACWGATGRNGGHCQPLLMDRSHDVAAFEMKNVEAVKTYIKDHKVSCEWRDVNAVYEFWPEEEALKAEVAWKRLKAVAPKIAQRVKLFREVDEIYRDHRVPPSSCPLISVTEGAASLWPYKLVAFILKNLIQGKRLNLQTWCPVTRITFGANGNKNVLHTPLGKISAPNVFLATNGYTPSILPEFEGLIVPTRGQMSALIPPRGSTIIPNSYGFAGALETPPDNDDYLVQRPYSGVKDPKGHLMFGGGRGLSSRASVGTSDDSWLDPVVAAYLRRALLKVLDLDGETEGLEQLEAIQEWTGIMGYSRDDHPWVGKVPGHDGIWLCGGYTGHGMPNGTLCGKAVVEMMLEEVEGGDLQVLQDRLIRDGDLPKSYLITKDRIAQAHRRPGIREKGC